MGNAADKKQATACGGISTQIPQAATVPTGNTGQATATTPILKMNGGLACSKMASGAGTATSNTATFRTLQPVVSQIGSMGTGANADNGALGAAGAAVATPTAAGTAVATACPSVSGIQTAMNCEATAAAVKQPYAVAMTDATKFLATDTAKNGGLSNEQIKKATRGFPSQPCWARTSTKLLRRLASAPMSSSTMFLTVALPMVRAGQTPLPKPPPALLHFVTPMASNRKT